MDSLTESQTFSTVRWQLPWLLVGQRKRKTPKAYVPSIPWGLFTDKARKIVGFAKSYLQDFFPAFSLYFSTCYNIFGTKILQ